MWSPTPIFRTQWTTKFDLHSCHFQTTQVLNHRNKNKENPHTYFHNSTNNQIWSQHPSLSMTTNSPPQNQKSTPFPKKPNFALKKTPLSTNSQIWSQHSSLPKSTNSPPQNQNSTKPAHPFPNSTPLPKKPNFTLKKKTTPFKTSSVRKKNKLTITK